MRCGDVWVAVISARRPERVQPMRRLLGLQATWYVDVTSHAKYVHQGASSAKPTSGLVAARNAALEDAFTRGLRCVQVSDDLTRLERYSEKHQEKRPADFPLVLQMLSNALAAVPAARLAGASPTANAYFRRQSLSTNLFIVGDLIMVRDTVLRFDPKLRLKEDYDYTCQHLAAYGCVARCNDVMPTFRHRSNPGGAVAYRTAALEQETIAYLMGKWPQAIKPNARRENEVLLRWPKEATA